MIAVVQRVREASVEIADPPHQEAIGRGLCVLLAVERGDTHRQAEWIASKLVNLRIFPDEDGKMNRSLLDVGGEILLISQFTLAGDCDRGMRPSFVQAADPEEARPLYRRVIDLMKERHDVAAKTGVFGGRMMVHLVNDGPVTLILRRSAPERP